MKQKILLSAFCFLMFAFGAQGKRFVHVRCDASGSIGEYAPASQRAQVAVIHPDANGVLYVDSSAASGGDGSSWAKALDYLSDATQAAGTHTDIRKILVAKGTYYPTGAQAGTDRDSAFFLPRGGLTLLGGYPTAGGVRSTVANPTILSGNIHSADDASDNSFHVVVIAGVSPNADSLILDGFTVMGGVDNTTSETDTYNGEALPPGYGGGIMIDEDSSSRTVIRNCTITDNQAVNGDGIAIEYSSSALVNCLLYNNGSAVDVANVGSASSITNCTLGTFVIIGGNSDLTGDLAPTVTNSIIRITYSILGNLHPDITYSYVPGSWPGTGDIDQDPLFVDAAHGDFRLRPGSPAMNAGNNAALPETDSTDLAGHARVFDKASGGIVDMGAYEFEGKDVFPDAGGVLYVDGQAASGGNGSSWAKALHYLSDAIAAADANSSVKEIDVAEGTYYPGGIQSGTDRDTTLLITRGGLKLYGGYPHGGGVRSGTGSGATPTVLSGDIGAVGSTGDNSYHVMTIAGVNATPDSLVIDGFTFTGGNANGTGTTTLHGAGVSRSKGGGVVLHTVAGNTLFRSCDFTGNNAGSGGGLYSTTAAAVFSGCSFSENSCAVGSLSSGGGIENGDGASTRFVRCIVSGNQAPVGGGVLNEGNSSSTFVNCAITGNNALTGGGLTNQGASASSLVNCTLSGNNAGQPMGYGVGGGLEEYNGSSCTLTNCIVWGNSGGIDGTATVNHSLVQGWTGGGADNLPGDADPAFIDAPAYSAAAFITGDYRLQPGSPAVNAGDNQALAATDTSDLAGQQRIFDAARGGIVDLGAYEYQGNPGPPVIAAEPADTAVCKDGQASFVITATGTAITYRWQTSSDGTNWADIDGAAGDTLTLSPVATADSGRMYRAVLSNVWAEDTSSAATLAVFSAPVIRSGPSSLSVTEGGSATFGVVATGLMLRYQWQQYINRGRGWADIEGATAASFTISPASAGDGGSYRVIVTGSCSETVSDAATLTILSHSGNPVPIPPGHQPPCDDPVITGQPQPLAVCAGSDATFSVSASGATGYQWQAGSSRRGNVTWNNIEDATSSTFTVPGPSVVQDGNRYRVLVFGRCSQVISRPATLTVSSVQIVEQPQDVPVTTTRGRSGRPVTGDITATFSVEATGQDLSYQWQSLALGDMHWTDIPGATLPSFTRHDITRSDDSTRYRVIVTGTCSSAVSDTATLEVDEGFKLGPIGVEPPGQSERGNAWRGALGLLAPRYRVFPNPVTDRSLTIQSGAGEPLNEVRVVDMRGHQILTTRTRQSSITLALPPSVTSGVYILEIVDGKRRAYTRLIIVQTTNQVFFK